MQIKIKIISRIKQAYNSLHKKKNINFINLNYFLTLKGNTYYLRLLIELTNILLHIKKIIYILNKTNISKILDKNIFIILFLKRGNDNLISQDFFSINDNLNN